MFKSIGFLLVVTSASGHRCLLRDALRQVDAGESQLCGLERLGLLPLLVQEVLLLQVGVDVGRLVVSAAAH